MELKEALEKVREGEVVFDGASGMKYFLFKGSKDQLLYVHVEIITRDKMRIAELESSQPDLLSKNWWESKWNVWDWDINDAKNEEENKT